MTPTTNTEKPKILLVDDNPANIHALERILEDVEAILITALSGKEALSAAIRHNFTLILMDVQMPIMDGFETAEILKRNKKTKDIPIIFITAISKDEKDIWKGYETGAIEYIFKPVEPVILKSKVRIFLEIYHRQDVEKQYSQLKQSHDQLKNVFKQQLEQEQKSIKQLSGSSKTSVSGKMQPGVSLSKEDPEFFNTMVDEFKILTEAAMETQVFKVDFNPSEVINKIAEKLRDHRATARDILKIYLAANKSLYNENDTEEKRHAVANEAKLLMIELMGHLLSFYREGVLAKNKNNDFK